MAWSDAARRAAALARKLKRALGPIAKGTSERQEVNRIIRLNRAHAGSIGAYYGALSHVQDMRKVSTPRRSSSLSSELRSRGRSSGLTPSELAKRKRLRGY